MHGALAHNRPAIQTKLVNSTIQCSTRKAPPRSTSARPCMYRSLPLVIDDEHTMPSNWRRPYSPGPLTEQEFEQYWTDGYVVKQGILRDADLRPCLQAIERRVDEIASRLLSAGLISDPCRALEVFSRLTAVEKQFSEASVLVHKDGRLPMEFATLWSHPSLLQIAQQLLGPAVGGHPSWNLRAKTPRQEAGNVPWHQDSAYCHPDSWTTLQVTAWVPLLDVTAAHGCMQMLRGGHSTGKTVAHTGAVGNTWYLAMDESAAVAELGVDFERDAVTVEMNAGDVLLFNNLIPHRSLDNTSNTVRWSLDLRWQHPYLPDGAFGLKRTIRMMQPGCPDYVIPWQGWMEVDKKTGTPGQQQTGSTTAAVQHEGSTNTVQQQHQRGCDEIDDDDISNPLSTILVGPWLDLWPITHENKHTRAWQKLKQQQDQQASATG